MNASEISVNGLNRRSRLALIALALGLTALLLSLLQTVGASPARASDYSFANSVGFVTVDATAVAPDGSTYVAGMFDSVNSAQHVGIAKFNSSGVLVSGWTGALAADPSALGTVSSLVATNDRVYVGGGFDSSGPTPYFRVMRADTGAQDTGFLTTNPNGQITAMVLSGSTLYIGGTFTNFVYNNVTTARNYAAALDAVTGAPTTWRPEPDQGVNDMVLSGTTMYMGGNFFNLGSGGGSPRAYLGAVSTSDTGTVTTWDPSNSSTNGRVESLALSGDGTKMYVGGRFTTLGGQTRSRLGAATTAGTGSITSWDPSVLKSTFPNQTSIAGIAVANGSIVVGGTFNQVGGSTTRNNVAAWRESDGALLGWTADTNDAVRGVDKLVTSATSAKVYIAGQFTTMTSGANTPLLQTAGGGQWEILAMPGTIPPQATGVSRSGATLNWSDPWFGGQQKVWVMYKISGDPGTWKTFAWRAGGGASAGLTATSVSLAAGSCPVGWTCPRIVGYAAGQTYDFDVFVTSWDNKNSAGPLTAEVTYTVPNP